MSRGLDELKVSDETGEAVLANIEADRAVSATTLNVDSLDNWPAKFIFATGTKDANNYIDPSTITIMYGHEDAGNIIIDGYAPGYTDDGNTDGQVAIVKPNTYAMDELIANLQMQHNNDGSHKNVVADSVSDLQAATYKRDFIAAGGIWTVDSGLDADMTAIVYFINGQRYTSAAITGRTFTVSKDTYIDIGIDGTVDYTEVTNGATPPALAADHTRLAYVVTNGSAITSIVYGRPDKAGYQLYNIDPFYPQNYCQMTPTNAPYGTSYTRIVDLYVDMPLANEVVLLRAQGTWNSNTASSSQLHLKIEDDTASSTVVEYINANENPDSGPDQPFLCQDIWAIPEAGLRKFSLHVKCNADTIDLTNNTTLELIRGSID